MNIVSKNEITTTVATLDNFPPEKNKLSDVVIYFCESHNKSVYERQYVRSMSDFLHRYDPELKQYEKYELRTGYLSRWNYMPKDFDQMSSEEIGEAIKRGYEEENEWLKRCEPELPAAFIPKDWKDCISEKENPYYQQCKEFINQELEKNEIFNEAFKKSTLTYAQKHESNPNNGWKYVLEEVAWVFSLPLVHPNKYIYLIHIGKANSAIKELFNVFPNFNKTVKWLRPHICAHTFKNDVDFMMYYNANRNVGCSYAIDNRNLVNPFMRTAIDKSNLSFERFKSIEMTLLQNMIDTFPAHIYWLNRDNVYLGCNKAQAEHVGLKSKEKIIGKTNFSFHNSDTAKELNNINELVMSTGKPYEVEESGWILGKYKDCLSKKIPIYDAHGEVIGLLGVSFDITEKKKIEELQSKLEFQAELYTIAKEVSHDIASPVSSLKIIEELYDGKLSQKDKRMLKAAITSIENMARKMLSKYRLIEQIEKVEEKEEEKYICPSESLGDIVESVRYRNKATNVEIKYEKVDWGNNLVFIRCDGTNFERMINNIINNGIEAAEGKKVEIEVTYKVIGEEVEIMVKDNGKGMPKEMAQKIEKGEEVGTTKKEG
ncbi:MAG: PAS domain-containing protein, partial [Endomicrobium sp.]|nr:PAS domain-containing protein [Endomicrobium sp.]